MAPIDAATSTLGTACRGRGIEEFEGKPCLIVAQRAPRRGIGSGRYGELLAYRLARGDSEGATA